MITDPISDAQAEKLLPCVVDGGCHQHPNHWYGCPAHYHIAVSTALSELRAENDRLKQGPKFLTLFDVNGTGNFLDEEIRSIRDCSWEFLLHDAPKWTLAHMVFRMADEIIKARAALSDKKEQG